MDKDAKFNIGEYHFNNRKFRDAISAYKDLNFIVLPEKERALAMFHMAKSYYNTKDYKTAISTLYQYITDIDKGRHSNDSRQEALNLMVNAFKKMKGDVKKQVEDFFKDKNASFKEEVYQLIQKK